MDAPTCGVVVPVRDEAEALGTTVPALLAACVGERPRIVWVCNGCSDASAARIRALAGASAEIVECEIPGKTEALQTGDDRLGDLFPRLYLDADVRLRRGDVTRLLEPIRTGSADLVAAQLSFDCSRSSAAATAIARCWLELPHARHHSFSAAIGLSKAGRETWDRWPRVQGDDVFVIANTPPERRRIVRGAVATTWAPASFGAWVRARRRWIQGERQLAALGFKRPAASGQRAALLKRFVSPRTMVGAVLFTAARVLGSGPSWNGPRHGWRPDRPPSSPADDRR